MRGEKFIHYNPDVELCSMRQSTSTLRRWCQREGQGSWRCLILLTRDTVQRVRSRGYLSPVPLSNKRKGTYRLQSFVNVDLDQSQHFPLPCSYLRAHTRAALPGLCETVALVSLPRIRQSPMDLPWTSFQCMPRTVRERLVSSLLGERYTPERNSLGNLSALEKRSKSIMQARYKTITCVRT